MVSPVRRVGVWQSAQPTSAKSCRPLAMEIEPPGVVVDGVGGARKRMKKANFSMALTVAVPPTAAVSVTSLGTRANWQFGSCSRSIWNSSLVMPISTLYASPEKRRSDWFCAFQPKREIVPSLPLRLGRP